MFISYRSISFFALLAFMSSANFDSNFCGYLPLYLIMPLLIIIYISLIPWLTLICPSSSRPSFSLAVFSTSTLLKWIYLDTFISFGAFPVFYVFRRLASILSFVIKSKHFFLSLGWPASVMIFSRSTSDITILWSVNLRCCFRSNTPSKVSAN